MNARFPTSTQRCGSIHAARHLFVQRGTAYFFKKQSDRALSDFNQAIRLDPASLQAYIMRGGIYGGSGRRDQAVADFRKALALDPANENVKKNLRELGAPP